MSQFDSAVVGKSRRLSFVWLLPVVAALVAGWLLYKNINETGLVVEVQFETGNGIAEGKTPVVYQGITVGKVSKLRLNADFQGVTAVLKLERDIAPLIREHTDFWLVSPQVSLSRISGLDTLVSGNYISFRPGDGDEKLQFTALSEVPAFENERGGLQIRLHASNLGTLSVGAPVLYQQFDVGDIESYHLVDNGVEILARIEPKYSHLVKAESHFWNVSGIKVEASLQGVKVETGSLTSMIAGGITFDSPEPGNQAKSGQQFELYPSHDAIAKGFRTRIVFHKAEGLRKGSSVRLKGMEIGKVESLEFASDSPQLNVVAAVRIESPYQRYLNADSRFWLVKPEVQGMNVRGLDTLISGPYIAVQTNGKNGTLAEQYQALSHSPVHRINAPGLRLKLRADELSSVDVGSKIYYRKIAVGQVESIDLDRDGVTLDVFIHDAYRNLVHRNSRFYNASGISINGGLSGLDVHADSVATILAGGIAFYTPEVKNPQAAWENLKFPLYPDFKSSQADKGMEIVLHFNSAENLSGGAELKYKGIKVGEVDRVELDASMSGVNVIARLEPTAAALAREGSQFWVAKPELGIGGTRNLETLVTGSYIAVKPGHGEQKLSFIGLEREPTAEAPASGLNLVLVSPRRASIKVGVKVFYRDVPVGSVYGYELSDDARNTHILINIDPSYVNLVRASSQFWNASGVDIDFSLFKGARIRSSSVEALIAGGIAFATPAATDAKVANGTTFELHDSVKPDWLKWNPGLPLGNE